MIKMLDLGWVIGKLKNGNNQLILVSPADDGTWSNSVIIHGEQHLITLRDALVEAYPIIDARLGG